MSYHYSTPGFTPIQVGSWYSQHSVNNKMSGLFKYKLKVYNEATGWCRMTSWSGCDVWLSAAELSNYHLVE